jgi:hypothetical protein
MALLLVSLAATDVAADKDKEWIPPVPGGSRALDCTGAIPINCGDIVAGDNTGAANTADFYSCVGWDETGGEIVYEMVIAEGACQMVTGTISGMVADLDIFLLSACDENACIEYGNDTFTSDCLEPGTYYIVVDGYFGAQSPFTLAVDCVPCDCPVPPCCPSTFHTDIFDFNESDHGFQTMACGGASVWQWGVPVGIPGVACDGAVVTNVLGTVLAGPYPNLAGEIAAIGPVMIEPNGACMELCHFYDIENNYDGGNVKVSTDGGATWTLVTPAELYDATLYTYAPCVPGEVGFTGHMSGFIRDCFDLSDYIGQEVMIGFFFGSDGSVTYPGWYIKWVKLGGEEGVPVEETSWGAIKSQYR